MLSAVWVTSQLCQLNVILPPLAPPAALHRQPLRKLCHCQMAQRLHFVDIVLPTLPVCRYDKYESKDSKDSKDKYDEEEYEMYKNKYKK